jgi:hypothetical protein
VSPGAHDPQQLSRDAQDASALHVWSSDAHALFSAHSTQPLAPEHKVCVQRTPPPPPPAPVVVGPVPGQLQLPSIMTDAAAIHARIQQA